MAENNNLLVKLDNCGVYKSSKWIVRGISLEIHKGKIVTLIGPNGSGKTTSAKMILKILKSDEGQIKNFASKMAYVPQKINIDWTMPLRVVDFMKLTSHINNLEIVEEEMTNKKKETQKELSDNPNCLLRIKKNEKFSRNEKCPATGKKYKNCCGAL